jgi:lambda family phage portal protein
MNPLDSFISWLSPSAGVRRLQHRRVLAYYEAASPNRLRKGRTAPGTGNLSVGRGGRNLREQARYYEQNFDIARGVLADLVLKTVGPTGIACEPQPRTEAGDIHDEFASQILELWKDWCRNPEVTFQHDWPSCQRLLARSWLRDGDVFAQMVQGTVKAINHGTTVPFSIEMIEADLVPLEYSLPPSIVQGVEVNEWGRPTGYWILRNPPGDVFSASTFAVPSDMKRVDASRILHCKLVDRIRQYRGVSQFAAVLQRFDDLKDYEESERIAAKIAASMAAYIKKGAPEDYATPDDESQRELVFRPGMIFDDLHPGEEIGMIDTNRPNPNLLTYRQGQLRAVGSGTGTSYSSVAKDYNGTYSAQRQELVESWAAYATLGAEFTSRMVRPVYEAFIATAIAAGSLKVPKDVVPESVDDAIYIAPQMPWIDPLKEVNASILAEASFYTSGPEVIRRRGGNPRDVLAQQAKWERAIEKAGLTRAPTIDTKQPTPLNNTAPAAKKGTA